MKPTLDAPNVYTSNVSKSPVVYSSCLLGIYYFNVVCTVHCIEHLLTSDMYTYNVCLLPSNTTTLIKILVAGYRYITYVSD
jgi:hypothetical protein